MILLLARPSPMVAQQDSLSPPADIVTDQLFESVEDQLSEIEEDADLSDELEVLLDAVGQRINLNDLSPEVGYTILHLTDYQYYQLQLYIEVYGELSTIYELAAVEGFDRALVERLSSLVEVRPKKKPSRPVREFFTRSRSTLLLRYRQVVERQAGYADAAANGYVGSPMRLAFKYSFQSGDCFAMALSGEKDAGEEFFRRSMRQGFDHYAFFVNIKNVGVLKNCVIGDYMLGFGQGLTLGARTMGVKGGGAAQVRRFPSMIRATAPMNESTNLRGAAVTVGNAQFSGTLFYSHRFFDGRLTTDSAGGTCFEGSLNNTGYHRTAGELAKRNVLRNRQYGGHFQWKRRIFEVGVTGMNTQFVLPVAAGTALYQRYGFAGKSVANFSTDYKVILRRAVLFGEAGGSVNGGRWGWGMVQGGIFDFDPRSKVALLVRYYSRNFLSLNGSAFAAGSGEELGVYLAADFVLGRRTTLSLHADIYRFPWLRFQVAQPSGGFDMGAKADVSVSKSAALSLKYQYAKKEQNQPVSDYYAATGNSDIHRFRLTLNSGVSTWLKLKTEVDYLLNVLSDETLRQGFLVFQDVGVEVERWNLGMKLRFAVFDTDSYAERLYAYENDLLYTFTVNGYYGKGIRYYFVVDYGYAFFSVQFRWSQTVYDDRRVISSGAAEIQGNTKSEVALQAIFHLQNKPKKTTL